MNANNRANDREVNKVEKITLDNLLDIVDVPPGKEKTTLTKVGYHLAGALSLYILLVTLLLLSVYLYDSHKITMMMMDTSLSPDKIDLYKDLMKDNLEKTSSLLDQAVIKSIIPVLTSILGYIFGTRGAD